MKEGLNTHVTAAISVVDRRSHPPSRGAAKDSMNVANGGHNHAGNASQDAGGAVPTLFQSKLSKSSELPQMPDLSNLISAEDIKSALSQLSLRCASLDASLSQRVTQSKGTIAEAERKVQGLAPCLELIHDEIGVLSSRLDGTADTAERVSKRVRSLDEEKKRLKIATQWAMDTSELKVGTAKAADP